MTADTDVVFVVLDSARKDRVATYGHDRETTPALDAIADGATVYENAFVPAPWTLPSHCSMFTGQLPSEHGVTNGFADRGIGLPRGTPTVAELLSGGGYATAGFSNNPWVGQLSGLNRGFDRFVEWDLEISQTGPDEDHRTRDAALSRLHSALGRAAGQPHALLKRRFFTANLVDRAKRWMAENQDRRSFTFLNLMEAHSPYYPPRAAFEALDLDPPGIVEPRTLNARVLAYVMGKTDLSPDTRDRVMEFYDASLRYQDGKLEELVSQLRSVGRYDDTLLVICADHGKTLGEYDRDGTPPHYVRDINVNVPLVIKWPAQDRGDRVERPVELADLFDTILERGSTGTLPERDDALVEDYVPHTGRMSTDITRWRVLADTAHKYVRNEAGDEYLVDRATGEVTEAVTADEGRAYRQRLRTRIEGADAAPTTGEGDADEDQIGGAVEGQLRDLGYLR